MSRRIGILGGTFDPIHTGHLDLGAAARDALALDEILVVPANIPPHRPQPAASSFHRFAMAALAVTGRPGWRVSDMEMGENRRSYTSETLARLQSRGAAATDLVFVLGADAFAEIETWHDFPRLFELAHFAVVSRPGHPVDAIGRRLAALAPRMARATGVAPESTTPLIFLIDRPTADVSSTAIRERLLAGQSIAGLVPDLVGQYIEQQELYRNSPRRADAGGAPANAAAGRLHGQD